MDPRLSDCAAVLPQIEAAGTRIRDSGDLDLAERISALRARVAAGTPLHTALPEVFAAVGEACVQVTGEWPTRQQFTAGVALHRGFVAEVQDGDGKDVAVLLAAVLGALEGHGVHVLTGAHHIASRQCHRARAVCALLDIRVGLIAPVMQPEDRRDNYRADIVYGQAAEFAYDYLRDNLAWSLDQVVQRDLHQAVVDDADVVLVDNCRAPHVISASAPEQDSWAPRCARLAAVLIADRHYLMPGNGLIALTDDGAELARSQLGVEDDTETTVIHRIRMALRAKHHYQRGRDYDVVDGRIVPLNKETGAAERTWSSDGLLQALEAKEGLPVSTSSTLLGSMTTRHYVRQYRRTSGISASVTDVSEGLAALYGLDVVTVPPHRPSGRTDHDDRLFLTDVQRDDAVLAEVLERMESGQAVVVGTLTRRTAERIIADLTDVGVSVRAALGTDPEQDAATLAAAGEDGAVTVLASAAGRGDETVLDGLVVLGAGRHRFRRHDEPLHGLAGRDGTTGECVFFLSAAEWLAQDDLRLPSELPPLPDGGLRSPEFTSEIRAHQRDADQAAVHRMVVVGDFDDVRARQADSLYEYRRRVLADGDFSAEFQPMLDSVSDRLAEDIAELEDQNLPAIEAVLAGGLIPYPTTTARGLVGASGTAIRERLRADAAHACRARVDEVETTVGDGAVHELQRRIVLACLDRLWRAQLNTMADLFSDVMTRAGSPTEMLSEFRADAATAYAEMWTALWTDSVGFFFQLKFESA
jgi:preprotein translocase subunit SecA